MSRNSDGRGAAKAAQLAGAAALEASDEIVGVRAAGSGGDERHRLLAEGGVRSPHHRGSLDEGLSEEHLLDFAGVHLLPAAVDDIVGSTHQVYEAGGVHVT